MQWVKDGDRSAGHDSMGGFEPRESRTGTVWRNPLPVIALLICWVGITGCRSTEGTESTGLAEVVIRGNTPGQISHVIDGVFGEHGYTAAESSIGKRMFEKRGTRMNNFAYGSWMGDTPIWVRVKVSIVPEGEAVFRVQCNAFLVKDKSSAAEEEIRINRLHRGTYQKLLEEVATKLEPQPTVPNG